MKGTLGGTLTVFNICCVRAVLEISQSFFNAIVNADKLKHLQPEWQHSSRVLQSRQPRRTAGQLCQIGDLH